MTTIKNSICALVAALSIGCGSSQNNSQPTYQTIKGRPLSVAIEQDHGGGHFSTVVDIDGKKVLCLFNSDVSIGCVASEAEALIQSEINDGDDESIELTGTYEGNKFNINSVTANGYTVDF